MMLSFSSGDKNSLIATTPGSRYEAHVVSIDGRTKRVVDSRTPHVWVDGWTPDGRGLIVDDEIESKPIIGILDTTGGLRYRVTLPDDARAEGWGGAIGYAATFRRGTVARRTRSINPLYVADARAGTIKELTPIALENLRVFITGRGGTSTDANRFLVAMPSEGGFDLHAFTVDGRSTLLRHFAEADGVAGVTVRGDQVAWAVVTRDSIIVLAARGPTGQTRRLAAVRRRKTRPYGEMSWSNDGSKLAVLVEESDKSSIAMLHVDQRGSLQGPVAYRSVSASGAWAHRWSADDQAILLIGSTPVARKAGIVRVPLKPDQEEMLLTDPADATWDDNFHISPDGKFFAYPIKRGLGASIWRVDFVTDQPAGTTRR